MAKSTFPNASHDFCKSNGLDHSFRTEGPSLTRQEFAEECDINTLMARYEGHVIGGPGGLAPMEPMYFDFTQHPKTLMEYMDVMFEAERAFMMLPAVVRKEFENSPQAFVDFASDPENLSQMRTWGLAPPAKEVPVAPPAKVAPVAAPEAAPGAPKPASTPPAASSQGGA